MQEYVSDAIVLHREPNGDMDIRFSLFTKHFGKMRAKAKSARKITSKLGPHLQVGNLVTARFVEKSGLQVVDALKVRALPIAERDLASLSDMLADFDPDKTLWHRLTEYPFSWAELLKILGWDPQGAACGACAVRPPAYFDIHTQTFICAECYEAAKSAPYASHCVQL